MVLILCILLDEPSVINNGNKKQESASYSNDFEFGKPKNKEQLQDLISRKTGVSEANRRVAELKATSMAYTSNIFQKEDNLQCSKRLLALNRLKWSMRTIFLAVIPINIIIYIIGAHTTLDQFHTTVSTVLTSQLQFQDYNQAQDSVVSLMMIKDNVYNQIDATDLQQFISTKQENLDESIESISSTNYNNYWLEVVYSDMRAKDTINQTEYVQFDDEFSKFNFTYDTIFQQMLESLMRISNIDPTLVNTQNTDAKFFNENVKKQLTSKIRAVIDSEILNLKGIVQRSGNLAIAILIVELIIFILSLFFIFKLIFNVISCFKEMLRVFAYIDDEKIKETEAYYKRVLTNYRITTGEITGEDDNASIASRRSRAVTNNTSNNNQQNRPKKAKGISEEGFLKKTRFRVLVFYIMSALVCSAFTICLQYVTNHLLDRLEVLLSDGQKYFQSISYLPDMMMALKQKQFNITVYENYIYPNIQDQIRELQSSDLATPLDQTGYNFEEIFNNAVSGDSCTYFKDALNEEPVVNYEYCKQVVLGKFTSGILYFKNYFQNNELLRLNLQDNSTVDVFTLFELDMGIETLKIISEQLLQLWQAETFDHLGWTSRILALVISLVSIFNFVIFILAEILVVGTLQKSFLFYREVYNRNMLTEALTQDKRIKYILVKIKVIQK